MTIFSHFIFEKDPD